MAVDKHEITDGGFYRSPGGKVVLTIPELDKKTWNVYRFAKGDWRYIHIYQGTMQQYKVKLVITIPPSFVFKEKVTAEKVSATIANQIMKASPFLKVATKPQYDTLGGGNSVWYGLRGTNQNKAEVAVAVVGLVDNASEHAFWITLEATVDQFSAGGEILNKIFPTVYIDRQIPILPDKKPKTPLEGVYHCIIFGATASDNRNYWCVFDRRGYCHFKQPFPAAFDVDAMALLNKKSLYTYSLKGNTLTLTGNCGTGAAEEQTLTMTKNGFTLFNRKYNRSDDVAPAREKWLDNSYEYFYYTSYQDFNTALSGYYIFKKNGTYTTASNINTDFTSYKDPFTQSLDSMKYGDYSKIDGYTFGSATSGKKSGFYRINGHFLTLINLNGEVDVMTILFADKDSVLYINGEFYTTL
ncbi:MAG: hypothetical protein JXJ04_14685 [Spirochaetales bacterium]|nr:hypothetical protein [Spirochaetales bacterium]